MADPRMVVIVFRREDFWYPAEYPADYSDWQAEADRNPGTTQIETAQGEVLWRASEVNTAHTFKNRED